MAFEADGHLALGRYQVDLEGAEAFLVLASEFEESTTRRPLWEGLERYLVRFWDLDEHFAERLGGECLVDRLWLGGSYVSGRLDPDNVDATVFVNYEAEQAIRGLPGSRWLTDAFQREKMKADFGLSPLRLSYRRVVSPFNTKNLLLPDRDYYRDRGAWDDWWQRRRASDQVKDAPTLETVRPVRGYLEVTL